MYIHHPVLDGLTKKACKRCPTCDIRESVRWISVMIKKWWWGDYLRQRTFHPSTCHGSGLEAHLGPEHQCQADSLRRANQSDAWWMMLVMVAAGCWLWLKEAVRGPNGFSRCMNLRDSSCNNTLRGDFGTSFILAQTPFCAQTEGQCVPWRKLRPAYVMTWKAMAGWYPPWVSKSRCSKLLRSAGGYDSRWWFMMVGIAWILKVSGCLAAFIVPTRVSCATSWWSNHGNNQPIRVLTPIWGWIR